MAKNYKSKSMIIAVVVTAVMVSIGSLIIIALNNNDKTVIVPQQISATAVSQTVVDATVPSAGTATTQDQLLYLIEEEKLAHDVYTVMYQTYGANVFGNILESETTHQGQVLTLLQARNIADPRSGQVGVFANKDLQVLYDTLITQGKQSVQDAYKVGVIIEEKDIADITVQLATATDQDVITTLESLRKGSENHLRAFNRQVN